MGLIGSIIMGILAGFIANKMMHKSSDGCLWNFVLGIIGAMAIRESNNTLERTQWVESEVNR